LWQLVHDSSSCSLSAEIASTFFVLTALTAAAPASSISFASAIHCF
jgi:hypothetical protein